LRNQTGGGGVVGELASGKSDPPRGVSFSAIRNAEGNYLLAYSVHFKSNLGALPDDFAKREEAARHFSITR
jgi:hypothetical protein